jgi:ABC-type hemin transport system substrate-binding protein
VETLFFLGRGNDIIGTSGHCSYPEEAKTIPVVSGISDLNLEFVIKEKPDAVFLMPSQKNISEKLDMLGIKNTIVPQETLNDILNSFTVIGKEIGIENRSEAVRDSFSMVLMSFKNERKGMKALISVGREYGSGVSYIYSNGRVGFLNDIIELLGYENALETSIPYPKIGTEGIMTVNPDIIIDLVPSDVSLSEDELFGDWAIFSRNSAYLNGKIYIFTGSRTTVPGPRIFDFIKELKEKGL